MKEKWPKSAWILYLIEIYFVFCTWGCSIPCCTFPNLPKCSKTSRDFWATSAKSMKILIYLGIFQGNLWFLGYGKQHRLGVSCPLTVEFGFFFPLHFLLFLSFKNHWNISFRPACAALFHFHGAPPALSLSDPGSASCTCCLLKLTWIFLIFASFLSFSFAKTGMLILDFPFSPWGSLNSLYSPFYLSL